jgi:ATP phosphoribosyltransferase
MSEPLIMALPSKGRLKEQAEAWLSDCGFTLKAAGGARGYRAAIDRLPEVQVQLLSAADIAVALDSGEAHLGVTGEDLLCERGEGVESRVMLLRPLGFGRADVVVAAPKSWIDVETMTDVEEVAAAFLARTGRRLRVATKYTVLTRGFFARHGVTDYRIVESNGATEGAPAAGAAELIVDITTTGATLAANNLKTLTDGVILKSQAQLAAALKAPWTRDQVEIARGFLRAVEARDRAKGLATVAWAGRDGEGLNRGLLTPIGELFQTAEDLAASGLGPTTANRPDYVFQADCFTADALAKALGL